MEWPYYQNDVNQIYLNHTTLWNLSLPIFKIFVRIFLNVNLSLNQTLLTFLLYVTNLDDSIDWQFLCEGLLSFNPKGFFYSNTWSCSLCEGRTSFCTWFLSRKLCGFLLMFSTGFTSFSIFLPFPLTITFFVFMHRFDAILSNIDDLLLINPLADVFASLLPHKDWLNLFWWNW